MGYLFVALAVFTGVTKGFCGKKISRFTSRYSQAMLANCVRMTLCIAIGFFVALFESGISSFAVPAKMLLISLLSGLSTAVFVVTWLISARRGSYIMLDVFLTLAVVIPVGASAIFFGEKVEWNHIVGFVLLLIAVIMLCSYNNSIKSKLTISSLLLLIVAGVSSGLNDFSQKLLAYSYPSESVAVFNFYSYVFSAIALAVVFTVSALKKSEEKHYEGINYENDGESLSAKTLLIKTSPFLIAMAVCLFANSYFASLSAQRLSSAQIYPLMKGGSLILSTLMSALFFGEKIKPVVIVGVAITFIGLLIINLL